MQSLVYIFILLAGLGVGAAGYFGLGFTPIEAFLAALACVAIAVTLLERTLRRRAEARLERGIEDLSRLLSTDAQAGAVLGQRINALIEEDAGHRLDLMEADVSVLGTVVRQVAEAVADLEAARQRQARKEVAAGGEGGRNGRRRPLPAEVAEALAPAGPVPPEPAPAMAAAAEPEALPPAPEPTEPAEPEAPPAPVIPLELLKQAIEDDRLVFHLQPVLALPQRRPEAYDLVPRLVLVDGEFADPPEFMPRRGGEAVVRRIERLALEEAVAIARRARAAGQPMTLHVPMSRATLVDAIVIDKVVALLEANRAVAGAIVLAVAETDWSGMPLSEKAALAAFVSKGVKLCLAGARSLRLDFAELAGEGVRAVRFETQPFIEAPERFSDFHSSDVAAYARRFGIDLMATGVQSEDQLLVLLEDGIALASGPHLAGPAPLRPDLTRPAERAPLRAQA